MRRPNHSPQLMVSAALLFLLWNSLFLWGQQDRQFAGENAAPAPEWARAGVVYEIFVRAFSPQGNFQGVTSRLDDLRQLGVNILWFMPIHPIGEKERKGTLGSPYSVRDYYGLNPDYGTAGDFKQLVQEAHQRGMKVIIDVVANHTAWDSVMMKQPEFYTHDASGKIIPPIPDWADVADLNYDNPMLQTYMIDMMKYWIRDYDLDGFRCDAAGMVPTSFWEKASEELHRVKPDILMLAEWSSPDLMVKAFSLDYAWPLQRALNEVLLEGKPAIRLRESWESERAKFPRNTLHLNFSDNHDERRALARFGEPASRLASVLTFTLDGVPLLYNGQEIGSSMESTGYSMFERFPIFWAAAASRPDFLPFYRQLIQFRKSHSALQQGSLEWLANSGETRVLTYLRRSDTDEFLIALNFSSQPFRGTVDLARSGSFRELRFDPKSVSATTAVLQAGESSLPALFLDAWGWRVYQCKLK
jgi:cyclomaltodextrinase / maltogenic alpha-amylase / neopullulanase